MDTMYTRLHDAMMLCAQRHHLTGGALSFLPFLSMKCVRIQHMLAKACGQSTFARLRSRAQQCCTCTNCWQARATAEHDNWAFKHTLTAPLKLLGLTERRHEWHVAVGHLLQQVCLDWSTLLPPRLCSGMLSQRLIAPMLQVLSPYPLNAACRRCLCLHLHSSPKITQAGDPECCWMEEDSWQLHLH